MSGPTVYRLLMQEAIDEARSGDAFIQTAGGVDRLLHLVAADEHMQEQARRYVREMVRSAYMTGVQHGYTQAAQEFSERPAPSEGDEA